MYYIYSTYSSISLVFWRSCSQRLPNFSGGGTQNDAEARKEFRIAELEGALVLKKK